MQAQPTSKSPAEHRYDLAANVTQKVAAARREFERTGRENSFYVWAQMNLWLDRLVDGPR